MLLKRATRNQYKFLTGRRQLKLRRLQLLPGHIQIESQERLLRFAPTTFLLRRRGNVRTLDYVTKEYTLRVIVVLFFTFFY